MKKWKCFIGIIILTATICICQKIGSMMLKNIVINADIKEKNNVVVIDAGHGAADPGKVGINEILEKDVNLLIAKKIQKILETRSIKVIMTRQDDNSLNRSKTQDLRERVNIINQEAPVLAVSIHQNSYTSESVKGAQVFYHKNSESGKRAAEIVQKELLVLDPDNTRQVKADTSYYLLKNTKVPLIIVECGFLSNQEEAEKLNTDEYQQKIAEAICSGVIKYLN